MAYPRIKRWMARPALSAALGYGLAFASVAAALLLRFTFEHLHHVPEPFAGLALSAIALTFWKGGTKPGILAVLLAIMIRSSFFQHEITPVSRIVYDLLVFIVFAVLMTWLSRRRDELLVKLADRTAKLTEANEELKTEIAERKRAEEELRVSEAKFRALAETAPAAILICQGNKFQYVNPALEMITGYSEDELLRMNFWDFAHPDVRDLVRERGLARQRGEPVPARYEFRIVTKAGEARWLDFTDGKFELEGKLAIVGMAFDITERKRAEEELRRSEERWRAVFENSSVGIALTDCVSTRFQAANFAFQKMVGYREEELRELSFMAITYEDDREANRQLLSELMEGRRQSFAMEKRYRRKDDSLIWVNLHVSLVPGEESIPRFSLAIVEDITERKRAEESQRDSEERFRATFENAGIAMALVDMQGRPIKSNPALRRMLGYSEEELSRMTFTEFTHPSDRDLDWKLYGELAAGKRDRYEIEKRYLQKGGGVVWGLLTVSLVKSRHGRPVYAIGMVQDITERRRAEEELQHSFRQLRALAARLQSIREEERKRVAREIHDELGQALTAIKIDLSSLSHELPAEKKQQSESILKLVDETIQSVRRISTELRPVILDEVGLVAAVEWAADEFAARTGTKCQLDLPQDDVVIDPECATALFRIFQETLTNVARHANATEVNVRLAKEDGDLTLEVHDNGQGVSEEQLSAGSSLGILGMRERALLLGGELTITGAPGEGTTVRVRIPETHPKGPKDGQ